MSDLSTPGTRHPTPSSSQISTVMAWWDRHSRDHRRTLRFWLGIATGLAAMTLLSLALRTLA